MKKIEELTDRELKEGMYRYTKKTESHNNIIRMWVNFFGLVTVLGVILIIAAISGERIF